MLRFWVRLMHVKSFLNSLKWMPSMFLSLSLQPIDFWSKSSKKIIKIPADVRICKLFGSLSWKRSTWSSFCETCLNFREKLYWILKKNCPGWQGDVPLGSEKSKPKTWEHWVLSEVGGWGQGSENSLTPSYYRIQRIWENWRRSIYFSSSFIPQN